MREVIQKVVAVEAEAKHLAQAARAEAEHVVASARLQARDLVEQAHQDAKRDSEKILAAAAAEAAREKAERLGCASAEINTNLRLDEAVAQPAVNAALCCLCGNSP